MYCSYFSVNERAALFFWSKVGHDSTFKEWLGIPVTAVSVVSPIHRIKA